MLAVFVALLSGVFIISMKYISNAASEELGLLPGSVIHYIVGSIVAMILIFVTGGRSLNVNTIQNIPSYLFLAGVFGLFATLISNRTLNKLPVLHTTALIITSQMITALVIDTVMFNKFSTIKTVGAVVVVLALVWDQKIIKDSEKKETLGNN